MDEQNAQVEIPAHMLIYAKENVNKEYFNTAHDHIENAIVVMRQTKMSVGQEEANYIDSAIDDLHKIEPTFKTGFISEDEINQVFAKAINSMAYAYLKISENELIDDNRTSALNALSIAIKQINYAMRFATDEQFDEEGELLISLIQIQENNTLDLNKLRPLARDLKVLVADGK